MAEFKISMRRSGFTNAPLDLDYTKVTNYFGDQFFGSKYNIRPVILASFLKRTPRREEIRKLTKNQAHLVLKTMYWDKNAFSTINSQSVANLIWLITLYVGRFQCNRIIAKALLELRFKERKSFEYLDEIDQFIFDGIEDIESSYEDYEEDNELDYSSYHDDVEPLPSICLVEADLFERLNKYRGFKMFRLLKKKFLGAGLYSDFLSSKALEKKIRQQRYIPNWVYSLFTLKSTNHGRV